MPLLGSYQLGEARRASRWALVLLIASLLVPAAAHAADGTITPGGAPVTVTIASAGGTASLAFAGTAGDRVSLELTQVTVGTSTCCSTKVSILRPDGKVLATATVGTSGGFVDTQTLPLDGTYTILVDPQSTSTGSVTLTLHDVPPDVTAVAFPGGQPVVVATDVAGQNGRIVFDGSTAERVSVELTDVTLGTSACCGAKVSILRPDGRTLVTVNVGRNGGFIDATTLPQDGVYAILVDPQGAATGSLTVTLYDVLPDVVAVGTPGGAPVTVTTTTPGQNAKVTFAGTAGQRMSLRLDPVCCSTKLTVLRPDGRTLTSASLSAAGGFVDTQTLPADGTYTVLLDPQGAAVGAMTLALYDVPADASAAIVAGGPSVTVSTTVPGQNARLAFDGVAGQRVSLQVGPVCCTTKISILKPGGATLLAPTQVGASGGFIDTQTLTTSGVHTIVVDPQSAAVGAMTFRLYDVPADVTGTIVPGGASVAVTTATPGQNGRLTFAGTAGQRVSLKVGPVCCSTKISLLKPSGATLASASFSAGGGFLEPQTLGTTGTYTIVVDPQGASVGNVVVTLYDVPADVAGTIAPGGPEVTVTTTVPGQNAKLTFLGTTGQRVSLAITGACCTTAVALLKPDGTQLAATTAFGGDGFLDVRVLPVAGTYTVSVNPQGAATGSVTLALYDVPPDVTGSITAGGTPVTVATQTPGQNASLTFAGVAGRRVSLEITNVTVGTSPTSGTKVSILRPDGTSLLGPTSVGTNGGVIDATTLPTSGTYTIAVDPQGANVGSMTLALHDVPADAVATIVAGGAPLTVTIAEPGQNARVSFSGSAGQRVSLQITNVTIGSAATSGSTVSLLEPDGSTLAGPIAFGTSGGFLDATRIPAAGTYTILVDPAGSNTGNATLTLHDVPADASGTIVPGGAPVTVTTATPGQNASLRFDGTAGGRVSLKVGPVCCIGRVSILEPDGTPLVAPTSMGTAGGFVDTQTLPVTGSYSVVFDPTGPATGSATFTLYDVPPDVTGTIAPGSSLTLTTTVPGQDGAVRFTGAAGDGIKLRVGPFNCCGTKVSILDPGGATLVAPSAFPPDGGSLFARLTVSGEHTIVVDPQGAATGDVHLTLELDNTAPAPPTLTLAEASPDAHAVGTTLFYRPAGAGGGFTVSATTSDGGAGLQKVRFPGLAGGFTPTSAFDDLLAPYSQSYSWSPDSTYSSSANAVTAYDKLGNTSSSSFAVTPDAEAPTTSDDTAAIGSAWKNTTQTVVLSASDASGSGAAVTHFTTNGSTPTTTSPQATSVVLASDGVYTVKYFSIDNVGNVEDVRTAGTAIRIDKTNPSSAVLNALPSVIRNGQLLTGSGSDALSGVASLEYLFCAGSACAPSTSIGASASGPGYPVTWTGQPPDGTYQVVARVHDVAGNTLDSAKRTVTVDNAAPETTITTGPASPTNTTGASLSFTASEAGSTFACSLDGGAYAPCQSPASLSGLTEGVHTFSVRATDPAGNTDETPATHTWRVDLTAPDAPTIDSPPNGSVTNTNVLTLAGAAEPGSAVEVFDGAVSRGSVAADASGRWVKSLASVADGEHTYTATATDAAGNTSAPSSAVRVVVDTAAPNTTIGTGPLATTRFTSASFTFAADDPAATFACRLDGAPFTACTSPKSYSGLAEGTHTFEVRATDAAGNSDPTPATRTWTIDATPPAAPTIDSPAEGSTSTTGTVTLSGTAEPGSTVQLFEGTTARGTTSVSAGGSWSRTLVGVPDGTHTYTAKASDAAGNASVASNARTIVVDTTAPETTIEAAPSALTNSASASFSFSTSETGATFECSLDGAAYTACSPPAAYAGLAEGSHTFRVRARDAAGNVDASPASHTWTIDLTPPDTTILSGPSDPTPETSAAFDFASTETGAAFECRLDDAEWAPCTGPVSYDGLAAGPHTFAVRATDAAGNTDATPATHVWSVT
ncbi:MAG: Ig-like domain-containing protein [Actinomycetota bacterium]|nr:Ig-like domain-containing protein [Actinomycetota bacterium]